jgi:osmoprotectant transport system ATP-binding protein
MIHLSGVSKSFDQGKTFALHPTTLELKPGQTTVLLGPSGCGKTTLLRLMIGLLEPTAGTIAFNGQKVESANLEQIRRQIGYVIQDGGLFPHMTARDNVTLMARYLMRWDPADLERRVQIKTTDDLNTRVAKLDGLVKLPAGALDRFPAQLSGGQRQRVGIMRALMLDPAVLFLDEPMGALDPLIRYELQEDLRNIFRTLNKTVVLVTHDMGEAAFFGDHLVLLKAGKIVQQGTMADLMQRPADAFVTEFFKAQRLPDLNGQNAQQGAKV